MSLPIYMGEPYKHASYTSFVTSDALTCTRIHGNAMRFSLQKGSFMNHMKSSELHWVKTQSLREVVIPGEVDIEVLEGGGNLDQGLAFNKNRDVVFVPLVEADALTVIRELACDPLRHGLLPDPAHVFIWSQEERARGALKLAPFPTRPESRREL